MRFYRPLLVVATILAFGVISLGAYVRLSDAGLGCPDWPGCYGHLIGVPDAPDEMAAAVQIFPDKPVDAAKAWKEMLHRYLAGTLGLLIAVVVVLAWKHRRVLRLSPVLPTALLGTVGLQAMLGMWTVTQLLKPVVVVAHLLGGMTILALLVWLLFPRRDGAGSGAEVVPWSLSFHAALALLALILQITLGGWVSSNQAALACIGFPACNGVYLPDMNLADAFRVFRDFGQPADGAPLSYPALTAVHWAHRVGALVVALVTGSLATRMLLSIGWRRWGMLLGIVMLAQITLGAAAVLLFRPLSVAVAHNAGAAALLCVTLALNLRLWKI
jgi:cytochrome c oxidase assembly protein subunit 15